MASKAIYTVVAIAGIAAASGAAWWYQKPRAADPALAGTAASVPTQGAVSPGTNAKPPSVEIAQVELARLTDDTRTVGSLRSRRGVVLRPENRQHLHGRPHVVYLSSSPDELFRRLRHDAQRPLLQVADPLGRLRDLHAQRDPLYRETAHFTVVTGRPSVGTLVNMIQMQLELAGVLPSS